MLATERSKSPTAWVGLVLAIHGAMLAWLGARWSPNIDEPAHLAAGLAAWQYGSLEFYCVNPPLMRAVATLPLLLMNPERQWGDFRSELERPEFVLGEQFVESHPDRWRTFLVVARWALIPFSFLGALCCYAWARDLFGTRAGVLALVLWCFCPNVLSWFAVIGTDGLAAAMGIAAGYGFWRWLKVPGWPRAFVAGAMLGVAQLSKMTWIPLFVLWPSLWTAYSLRGGRRTSRIREAIQLAALVGVGWYVLNLGYAFDGAFRPLGEYRFRSRLLGGEGTATGDHGHNRFLDTWCRHIPVPFPCHYVRGIDLQRVDFELGKPSYLGGEWSEQGWWYYYFIGLVLKVPLGIWGLAVVALTASLAGVGRRFRGEPSVLDQCVLLAPALMVMVLVTSQDGFSRHFRYLLPAFPFLYVWISKGARWLGGTLGRAQTIVVVLVAWSVASSLIVFPHCMSYFNELAGGPLAGHQYLLHSSFSWSQDDFYLKSWLDRRPEIDAPYIQLERGVRLERLGLRTRGEPPPRLAPNAEGEDSGATVTGPVPGWHVISVQHIHEPDRRWGYFREFTPVAKAGYSVNVYHITPEEANNARRRMGYWELCRSHPAPHEVIAGMLAASAGTVRAAVFHMGKDDEGAAEALHQLRGQDAEISLALLSAKDIQGGKLEAFDVLIVPGGRSSEQGAVLCNRGRHAVREFVQGGGGYVGICAGAVLATTGYDWSLGLVNARTSTGMRYVPGKGWQRASFRGWGTVRVGLTGEGEAVLGSHPSSCPMEYTGGPILLPAGNPQLPDYFCLAHFQSEIWLHPFQKDTMVHSPAIVAAQRGQGRVILFSPHPETSPDTRDWLLRAVRSCAKTRHAFPLGGLQQP